MGEYQRRPRTGRKHDETAIGPIQNVDTTQNRTRQCLRYSKETTWRYARERTNGIRCAADRKANLNPDTVRLNPIAGATPVTGRANAPKQMNVVVSP